MTPLICDRCRYPIPADAPAGVCPRCLLATAGQIRMDVNQGPGHQSPTKSSNDWAVGSSGSIPSSQFQPTVDANLGSRINQSLPSIESLNQRFDDLEVLERIGQGGMGAVFKVRQIRLDRIVALKIISPALSQNPAFVERFSREAKTMARLAHRNIITVFDFGIRGKDCYLLMEYVDGINLRQAIQGKTISAPQALDAVRQICDALQYAHDNGIVHRDIKPENILIDSRGQVKVADFGLAKLIHSDSVEVSITGTNQILGTRNYMAPEQIEKPETVDHRADIYSLGVVFYELLTGELPIGRFANPSEKSQLNQALDQVVLKTLEKEPVRRYQQASEISVAMQAVPAMATDATPPTAEDPRTADPHAAAMNRDRGANPPEIPTGPQQPYRQPQNIADATFLEDTMTRAAQASQVDPASASCHEEIFCPFKIDKVYEGFAKAHGLARVNHQGIELELEIRDDVFQVIKSKTIRVELPIAAIHSVRLENTFWGNIVVFIQAKTLEAVNKVPNSKHGLIKLAIDKADREMASQLVAAIQELKSNSSTNQAGKKMTGHHFAAENAFPMSPPVAPVKSDQFSKTTLNPIDRRKVALEKLSMPSSCLTMLGIIVLVFSGLGALGNLGRIRAEWNRNFFPSFPSFESFINSCILLRDPIVPLALGILMIVAAQRMKQLRSRWLCILGCVVAMLPFYSFYTLGFFLGVWGLVVLLNPDVKREFDAVDEEDDLNQTNANWKNTDQLGLGQFSPQPVNTDAASANQNLKGFERYGERSWWERWAASIIALLVLAGIAILVIGGLILLASFWIPYSNFEINRGDEVTTIESNGAQIIIERNGKPSVKIQNKQPSTENKSNDPSSDLPPKQSRSLENSEDSKSPTQSWFQQRRIEQGLLASRQWILATAGTR